MNSPATMHHKADITGGWEEKGAAVGFWRYVCAFTCPILPKLASGCYCPITNSEVKLSCQFLDWFTNLWHLYPVFHPVTINSSPPPLLSSRHIWKVDQVGDSDWHNVTQGVLWLQRNVEPEISNFHFSTLSAKPLWRYKWVPFCLCLQWQYVFERLISTGTDFLWISCPC